MSMSYDPISNQIPIENNLIKDFHSDILDLSKDKFSFKISQLYKKHISMSLDESDISNKVKAVSLKASEILQNVPEDFRDRVALREKLKDVNFKLMSQDGTEISHEDIQCFCDDIDILFLKIYPKLEKNPFSNDSSQSKMPKNLQNYLSPELKKLRSEKQEQKMKVKQDDFTKEELIEKAEKRTQRKILKGQFAVSLGQGIKANKGATGTLIIKDINGKPVGVHKVSEKDVPILTRIKNLLKSIFGGQLSFLSKAHLAQPRSERAAYLVSRELGFDLAPPSAEATIQGKVGVFQVFISKEKKGSGVISEVKESLKEIKAHLEENNRLIQNEENGMDYPKGKGPDYYIEAADIGKNEKASGSNKIRVIDQIDSKKKGFTEAETTKFQKFTIFDYLIGNLDRHEQNWFVTVSPDKEITNIRAIDNANAFPKKQPGMGSLAARNRKNSIWQKKNLLKVQFSLSKII